MCWILFSFLSAGFVTRFSVAGLWGECSSAQKCEWFFNNDFQWIKSKPGKASADLCSHSLCPVWFQACQGLFGVAILTLLSSFLTGCFNLCCGCCKESKVATNTIVAFLILACELLRSN